MPEVSENAAILLAISWQAFDRIKTDSFDRKVCDSVVAIVFACFYIEESFNVIIDEQTKKDKTLVKPGKNSGMLRKCLWLFNEFFLGEDQKIDDPYKKNITNEFELLLPLSQEFPDFLKLKELRNCISHGEVKNIMPHLDEIANLRQSAKDIVGRLLNKTKLEIRNTYYQTVMANTIECHQEELIEEENDD